MVGVAVAEGAEAERDGEHFWIVPIGGGGHGSSMNTLECPAHMHGTADEAFEKLQGLLKEWPKNKPSTVWVCRANMLSTLERFAPAVDQVTINPFVHLDDESPEESALSWPGADHPVLNNLRTTREVAGETRTIAWLDLRGEPRYFDRRQAAFEEVEWMTVALVGANYQGIIWRHDAYQPGSLGWEAQLRQLEAGLSGEADGLGTARPVDWITGSPGELLSAVAAHDRLYVCMLNPDYMQALPDGDGFRFPLESEARRVDVALALPEGVDVVNARYLRGGDVPVEHHGDQVSLSARLRGGGEIVVVEIVRAAPGPTAGQEAKR